METQVEENDRRKKIDSIERRLGRVAKNSTLRTRVRKSRLCGRFRVSVTSARAKSFSSYSRIDQCARISSCVEPTFSELDDTELDEYVFARIVVAFLSLLFCFGETKKKKKTNY